MKQAEIARWLKSIAWAVGIMGAVVFFGLVPVMANEMKCMYPEAAFLYWPGLAFNFLVAAGCYIILFQFWTICREIGRDNSFSKENASAFKKHKQDGGFVGGDMGCGIYSAYYDAVYAARNHDFFIFAIFLSFIVAICAAALSHLVLKAYELKLENELTI